MGDVFFRKLCHGGREDHLRTEMAELHGFGVAELVDDAGRRDHAGIGGHQFLPHRSIFPILQASRKQAA